MRYLVFLLAAVLVAGVLEAQNPLSRFRGGGGSRGGDTVLKHRTEDTIVINYRYLDSTRLRKIDSSIFEYSRRNPLPPNYIDVGNLGAASKNLVFTPSLKPGWDPGWHAWDPYVFTVDETQFFTTTKPYTELGYVIGSSGEQLINVVHTQNITPNWNALFQYRLISAPGYWPSSGTNHNNYRFSTWYQSKSKRYQLFLVAVGSKLKASENGGLRNISQLDSLGYGNPDVSAIKLGVSHTASSSPFGVNITTGSYYTTGTFMLRQQYDLVGIKDSVVTDSTVTPLFYPKFRIEHTISYSTYHHQFLDNNPDTVYYVKYLNFISTPDTVKLNDLWHSLTNDFSLYQFPDGKNPQQFFKAGIAYQTISGTFDAGSRTLYNVYAHGEYRNRTKNKKWDVEANGNFYINGYNAGDYNAYINLKRFVSSNIGYLEAGFQNSNKTLPVAWNQQSSFGFGLPDSSSFNKENITNLFAYIDQPKYGFRLGASYYLLTNYPYFHSYYIPDQQASPFNVLQISADKVFHLTRFWVWRASLVIQQKAGSAPINIPLIVTHGQVGYEGTFGLKNLVVAFGVEYKYFSAYKADGYSPPVGQFFTQNTETIKEKLPDLALYLNMRIRSFTAYVRVENLNTARVSSVNGFGFTNYNYSAPDYPMQGLRIRFGFYWGFVN